MGGYALYGCITTVFDTLPKLDETLPLNVSGFGAPTGAPATAAPPAAQSSTIQQHLLSLAASPYGENPLFKLSDTNRRQEVMVGLFRLTLFLTWKYFRC